MKIEGYIESKSIPENPESETLANGTVDITFDTAQSYLYGNSYTAT